MTDVASLSSQHRDAISWSYCTNDDDMLLTKTPLVDGETAGTHNDGFGVEYGTDGNKTN